MKIIFLALPLVYTLANGYLYLRTLQAFAWLPLWGRILLSLLFWLVAFSLFVAVGLRDAQLPDWTLRTLFVVGSVWMALLLYMVLLLAVLDLLKIALPTMGHTFWYALPACCALLIYGYINYRNQRTEHIEITTERAFEGKSMRIVAISDVHLGHGTGTKVLQRYVRMINDCNPDVVLIAGDLIDNSIKPLLDKPFDALLDALQAPLGVYMVPGNHEYISGIDSVTNYLKHTKITLLRDSVVTLPNGVQIVGRDDHMNRNRKPLLELLQQSCDTQPIVVLDHQPYNLSETDKLKVDLLLCGHTHRGQLFPLNLLTDHLYEQSHGYRHWSYTHIFVSSGLSLWGPPFRIGTHSDLAVIDIKCR
ncbi:MAG: metallophosphoesterase [Alistipes sp.]|nr:metallophosphoesterase [Alistipes sp.]